MEAAKHDVRVLPALVEGALAESLVHQSDLGLPELPRHDHVCSLRSGSFDPLNRPDSFGQLRVDLGASGPVRLGGLPSVLGRALKLARARRAASPNSCRSGRRRTPKRGYQFVSPATYLAALWRISRSVVSLVVSGRNLGWSHVFAWRTSQYLS